MLRILLILPLLSSCASTGNEGHIEKSANAKIAEKRTLYCEKSPREMPKGCDGLLFKALLAIGCGGDISEYESDVEPGRFYRDPAHDCFVPDRELNGSDSTISKDMLVGVSAYLAVKRDTEMAKRIVSYGEQEKWIVGEAKDTVTLISKCYVTPALQNVFKKLAELNLTEQDEDMAVGINVGYQAHLDVLAILVKGKVNGSISNFELTILKEQAKRQPRNAFFQAAKARYDDGDFSKAIELLSDESMFPSKELPNNHQNYCTDYLWQRDEKDHDWKPCPSEQFRTHDGLDVVLASAVMEGIL